MAIPQYRLSHWVDKECPICGKPFSILRSRIARGDGKYCSKECRMKWHAAPIAVRFQRFIGPPEPSGCIHWKGGSTNGYGRMSVSNKSILATHVSWELANGKPVPDGLEVMHTCDNPICVNSAHLVVGTHKKNMEDAGLRERLPCGPRHHLHHQNPNRIKHHAAKLTEDLAREIRELYKDGSLSQPQLARKFGVSQATINGILLRKTWKHV